MSTMNILIGLVKNIDRKERYMHDWITTFKFIGIGLDIVVFALIGYLIGKEYGNEIAGAIIGTVVGAIFMWIYLFIVVRRLGREIRYGKKRL